MKATIPLRSHSIKTLVDEDNAVIEDKYKDFDISLSEMGEPGEIKEISVSTTPINLSLVLDDKWEISIRKQMYYEEPALVITRVRNTRENHSYWDTRQYLTKNGWKKIPMYPEFGPLPDDAFKISLLVPEKVKVKV